MFGSKGFLSAAALLALALSLASPVRPEEICDCEEKPKCPSEAPKDCGGGRGLLMVPGGEDCSCCKEVCPRRKGESCEGPHSLACDHGLICGDSGVCTEESSLMSGAHLTALSATETTLTLGWKGPPGYVIQYREVEDGAGNKTEGPWRKFEKMTETPEWNATITDLKPEKSYEARAVLPGPEGVDQGRLGEPEAAVRAEVGCACPRPFFRIGTVNGDSGCTERPMAEKPCCVLVVCADSQTSESETPNKAPRILVNATVNATTTAAPMNSTEKMGMNKTEASAMEKCTHKNETLSVGEVFHDGCEEKCTCEAGGKVLCKPRCEEMPRNISSKCFSIPDPQDVCCTKILCDVTLGDQDTNPNAQESKGSPDAASTTMHPATHNVGKEGCTYNGRTYAYDQEFHDGCRALCICSHDGEVECAPIHCPTDSGLDVLDPHCVAWEPVPMEPGEDEGDNPTCCPEVRCKDNGSCEYAGQRFDNFAEIPASVGDGCSGHRCFCEFGNITCGGGGGPKKCPPVPAHPPLTLECLGGGPGSAVLAHPPGDNCCLAWVCPENAHLLTSHKGSTNSSAEGPVPEVMMIPQVDNVTVTTDDKAQPMTTMKPNNALLESVSGMEMIKSNMTKDTMDKSMNVANENNMPSQDSTTSPPTTMVNIDVTQNMLTEIPPQNSTTSPSKTMTDMDKPMSTMLQSKPDIVEHREDKSTQSPSTPIPSLPSDTTTEFPHTLVVVTQEINTEALTGPTTMRPIVVDEKPTYQSPWGNIGGRPEVRVQSKNPKIPGPLQIPEEETSAEEDPYSFWYGATPDSPKKNESTVQNKDPQIPGPIRIPEEESSAEEDPYSYWYGATPDSPKKNGSKFEIPFSPDYYGPLINKAEEPVQPFKPMHDGRHTTTPNSQQKPNESIHKKPKHPDDSLPIFLRYPVQSGKKQRVDPQKSRLPERPASPNVNDFEYQGPFHGVPPSAPGDHIVFHSQGGNIKQGGTFPTRPNGLSKSPGNIYGQQPPPFRQPSGKYPVEHDAFPGPLLIHPGQRLPISGPPNLPPRVTGPGNRPIHGGLPIGGNAVQHHQGGSPPHEHFQIQDLDGGPVPPEIAQHILWALQGGRHPAGRDQRPHGPPQQDHRILQPQSPPQRGPPQGIPMPQDVFFHLPPGAGPVSHPGAQNQAVFIPNQDPNNYRGPPRITQPQNSPPHLAQSPPHGPPHFLPGVEPEFLPPELYHLAFGGEHPDKNNRTKQETSLPSKTNKAQQPPMTHDHDHLTEDLPLNHPGTDFGRPPPPPPSRFPEVPLHPQLHPQLHNVGVSSPSDEISIDSANVQPDSSVHLVFSLPSLFVGLHGQVEISYTQDPLKEDPANWEGKEIVSTPGDLIETRRLEYTIPAFNGKTGLQPNKVYRIRIMLLLRNLENSPSSRIITIHTPSGNQVNTTQLPAQIEVDAELGIAEVNSTWARFVWRKFNDFELQFIDGVQLRYKEIEGKVYSTSQLLHRATASHTLEGLRPSSTYEVSLLLVPFPDQKTELIARETLHITTAAEKDPYGFDLKIKVDAIKVFSAEVSWSGVPYPEDKYVNIFRVIYQSDSAGTKGGEGSEGGPDGEERSSTFKIAKRDPSPSALVTGLKPGTRYRMWLEAYLTNGRIKKSDVKDIVTKPSSSSSTKQGKLEASVGEVGKKITEESGDYYGGLVGVSILAALAFVAILILLLMLLKRQGQAKKAAISTARKSESAYDNPTYKTSDHDSTNGRIKNSARLQEA